MVAVVLGFPHRRAGDFFGESRRRRELGVDGVVLAGGLEAVGEEGSGGGVVEGGGCGGHGWIGLGWTIGGPFRVGSDKVSNSFFFRCSLSGLYLCICLLYR